MTTNPYTPDETELRDCYAMHMRDNAGESIESARADAKRGIARIKAEALREAADMLDEQSTRTKAESRTLSIAAAMLRDAADREGVSDA